VFYARSVVYSFEEQLHHPRCDCHVTECLGNSSSFVPDVGSRSYTYNTSYLTLTKVQYCMYGSCTVQFTLDPQRVVLGTAEDLHYQQGRLVGSMGFLSQPSKHHYPIAFKFAYCILDARSCCGNSLSRFLYSSGEGRPAFSSLCRPPSLTSRQSAPTTAHFLLKAAHLAESLNGKACPMCVPPSR
jgi:hypothetical protein